MHLMFEASEFYISSKKSENRKRQEHQIPLRQDRIDKSRHIQQDMI